MPMIKSGTATTSSARGAKLGVSAKDETNSRRDIRAGQTAAGLETASALSAAPETAVLSHADAIAAERHTLAPDGHAASESGAYSMMELLAAPEIRTLAQEGGPRDIGAAIEASATLFDKHRLASESALSVAGDVSQDFSALPRAEQAAGVTASVAVPVPVSGSRAQKTEASGSEAPFVALAVLAGAALALWQRKALKLTASEFKNRADNLLAGGAIGALVGLFAGFVAATIIAPETMTFSWLGMNPLLSGGLVGGVGSAVLGAVLGYYQDTRLVGALGRFAAGASIGGVFFGLAGFIFATMLEGTKAVLFKGDYSTPVMGVAAAAGAALGVITAFWPDNRVVKALSSSASGALIGGFTGGTVTGLLATIVLLFFPAANFSVIVGYVTLVGGALGALVGGVVGYRHRNDKPGSRSSGGSGGGRPDDLLDPSNPQSPVSPINPANPLSPLSPLNPLNPLSPFHR